MASGCDRDLREDEDEDFLDEDMAARVVGERWGARWDERVKAEAAVCGASEVCVV